MKYSTMKKLFAALTATTMALGLLAGCGAKKDPSVGMANPLTEVSAEEMTVASGIALDAPVGAEDVKYFTLKDGDSITAQVTFTLNGVDYTYRAQTTSQMEAYDMSGLNYTDWTVTEGDVAYCTATVETNKEAAAAYWLDIVPGINYTLGATKGISADELLQTANLAFTAAQGDSDGDFIPADYTGYYLNGQDDAVCDSVRLTLTESGAYDVQINILQLASFEGEGHIMDGAVEFTVTDPNGNPIDGIFYPTAKDVYALTFTVSKSDLMESGAVMENFVPAAPPISDPYTGYYLNGQDDAACDFVCLMLTAPGTYDVQINIRQLASFEGEGHIMDGAVEFTVTDPNGNPIDGIFYPTAEDVYALTFTVSKSDLLKSGAVMENFVPVDFPEAGLEDYTGHYLNGQDDAVCDSVRMTLTEPGTYDVQINILRLASFEGEGHTMDGAVEFTVIDPNGNPIDGIFYPTAEDVYALTFTVSNWNLLESGTVMENFVPVTD